jgi:hypothetical protein
MSLAGSGAVSGLADQHSSSLRDGRSRARCGETRSSNKDHVRRLHRAHSAQREELRIAGPRADEHHRSAVDGFRLRLRGGEEGVEIGLAAAPDPDCAPRDR